VLRIVAAFSRHDGALAWGREKLCEAWGPVALESEPFPFVDSTYYDASMGTGIQKSFWAFETPADAGELPAWKLQSNEWEAELAASGKFPEERPLNLDPGYLTLAKLVLASTKDFAHRIYLRDGIFAEITLFWRQGKWEGHQWTFPDYRRPEYHRFFTQCREYLHGAKK